MIVRPLTRSLFRYPALLLVPATIALWGGICSVPLPGEMGYGYPLPFLVYEDSCTCMREPGGYDTLLVTPLLLDLVFVIAVGMFASFALDYLILSRVRAARERREDHEG